MPFRVSISNIIHLDQKKNLEEFTKSIVEMLISSELTVKECKAILKDALETVESISNDEIL